MNMQWLHDIVQSEFWYHAIVAVGVVAVFGLCSRAVRAILKWLAERLFSKTQTVRDERIVEVILAHVRPLLLVIGSHIAVREVEKGIPAADATAHQILGYAQAALYIVTVILVVKIVVGITREVITWYLESVDDDGSGVLKETLGPMTGKIAGLLIWFLGAIIVLDHFGVSVGSLLVSLGVGSLAVALAAQDTLANMIAGFVILIDRPFRVGDRVELPSGQVADVLFIGLRSTRMVNLDRNVIILPNAELVKGRIVNYSSPFSDMRVVLKMNVGYGTEIEKVRNVLLELARKHPDILAEPVPTVEMTALNDFSVECTLMARASDFTKAGPAASVLREQAYRRFIEERIEMPLPQRVVHMTSQKPQ